MLEEKQERVNLATPIFCDRDETSPDWCLIAPISQPGGPPHVY
jgi:hypothetical protein